MKASWTTRPFGKGLRCYGMGQCNWHRNTNSHLLGYVRRLKRLTHKKARAQSVALVRALANEEAP